MRYILLLAVFLSAASLGFAVDDSPGAAEIELLNTIFTGNIGLSVGLIVLTIGIYKFFYKGDKHGVVMIVLGALITLTPGFYNAMRSLFIPAACALADLGCSSS